MTKVQLEEGTVKFLSRFVQILPVILALALFANSATASSVPFTVPGTANPFFAGYPSGTMCCFGDSAPAESPVLVPLSFSPGDTLTFTGVTGSVSYAGGTPTDPPDGNSGLLITTSAYEAGNESPNNIAGFTNVPIDALIGLFLGPTQPSSAPSSLDFGVIGLNFASLSPGVDQTFFIGDGLTGNGTGSVQTFIVPSGATRLFLGTVDGFGWYNNSGAISGTVNDIPAASTPEPSSLLLVGTISALIVGFRKRTLRAR